ncbi:MAG: tail fiber domain-containing protein [Candidatus Aenigmarchaeota archaeon]|nr:tail fiber domain-containing protein [Candidatus Aenigmarchaeota archaeon]
MKKTSIKIFLVLFFELILFSYIVEAKSFIVYNASNESQTYFIVNGTSGYVGIGTIAPNFPLHVIGDVGWTGTLQTGGVPWARLVAFPDSCSCPEGYAIRILGSECYCDISGGTNVSLLHVWNTTHWIGWLASSDGVPKISLEQYQVTASLASDLACIGCVSNEEISEVSWSKLINYPEGCGPGKAVQAIGTTLTCVDIATFIPWDNSTTQIFVREGYPTYVNVSNALFVNGTSGNVGIGTYSPTQKLHINGSLRVDNSIGSAILFVNDTSGNVGIGTTAPAYRLDVSGSARITNQSIIGYGQFTNSVPIYVTTTNPTLQGRDVELYFNSRFGGIYLPSVQMGNANLFLKANLRYNVTATLGNGSSFSVSSAHDEALDSAVDIPINNLPATITWEHPTSYFEWTDVLIFAMLGWRGAAGSTSAGGALNAWKLEVYDYSSGTWLTIVDRSGVTDYFPIYVPLYRKVDTANYIRISKIRLTISQATGASWDTANLKLTEIKLIRTRGNPPWDAVSALSQAGGTLWGSLYVMGGGNVGIGTTSPDVKLDVDGDIEADLLSTGSTVAVYAVAGGANGGAYKLVRYSSSERYKKDINDFNLGLETVLQLQPREFTWKSTGERDFGFIAEEVEKVNPFLITYVDGKPEAFKHAQYTAVLTNAIKQLYSELEELKKENQNLKTLFCSRFPEEDICLKRGEKT